MKIVHVKSAGILADDARQRLEQVFYQDAHTAMRDLKLYFPHHVVSSDNGYLPVMNKDRSITVALFKEVASQPGWVKTNLGLGPTTD